MPKTAKIFVTGRSQAVRLPKEFRFKGNEVRIRKEGSSVILEPINDDWEWLNDIHAVVDKDFEEAAEEQLSDQKRPDLDFFE